MFFKFPKDTSQIQWTKHVKNKMVFYRLSASKTRCVLRKYVRKQSGLAPHTVCYMIRNDKLKRQEEIWVMTQNNPAKSGKTVIISAWLYPGISPIDANIPIPPDLLEEILKEFV